MSFLNVITKSYHGVSIIIRRYWSQYGWMSVLLSSVYLHFSLFLTMILYPFWAKNHWTDMALHIIPFFIIISCMTLLMWIYFRKQFILHFKNNDIYIRLSANFTSLRGKPRRSGQGWIARTAQPSYNGVAADNQGSLRQGMPEVRRVLIFCYFML